MILEGPCNCWQFWVFKQPCKMVLIFFSKSRSKLDVSFSLSTSSTFDEKEKKGLVVFVSNAWNWKYSSNGLYNPQFDLGLSES